MVTLEEAGRRLQLSETTLDQFRQGLVVTEERAALNDKNLTLIVGTLISASLAETHDFLVFNKAADIQDSILEMGTVENPSTAATAGNVLESKLQFSEDTLTRLATDPVGTFFMSTEEAQRIQQAVADVPEEEQRSKVAHQVYCQILQERIQSYWETGLEGLVPYSTGGDPRDDLQQALQSVLEQDLIVDPECRAEMSHPPSQAIHPSCHSITWALQKGRDQESAVLTHRFFYYNATTNSLVGFGRKFFSGGDYDAGQMLMGAVPVESSDNDDNSPTTAIFYVNHTFTSNVAGWGGSAKKIIGRQFMKAKLVDTFTKGQARFAAQRAAAAGDDTNKDVTTEAT